MAGRYQVLFYIGALLAGVSVGLGTPGAAEWLARLVWPALAILLYATFCQVRLSDSLRAYRHRRFMTASLLANFVFVPLIAWALSLLLPPGPAVRLGVFMVLLVPCTDWFVTFTHLGRGDTRLAVALVPAQLLVQFALLRCTCGCSSGGSSPRPSQPAPSSRPSSDSSSPLWSWRHSRSGWPARRPERPGGWQ